MSPHQLSRTDARRIAVTAQQLGRARPDDVLDVVRRLTLLQLDPTKAIAPSAELVVWSRVGSGFRASDLWDAVDELALIELRGMLRPAEDLVLYRAEMEQWPGPDAKEWEHAQQRWVEDNNACRMDILDLLRTDGPLPVSELPDTCVRPWKSTGWNNNRNVTILLDLLVKRGEVAAAGGTGRKRLWDLAERIYPDDPPVPLEQARVERDRRRLAALGIARPTALETPGEPLAVNEVGEPAVVEGVKGQWRVDPAYLGQPFQGRAALLSPFDRMVYDRRRTTDLFEFEYFLEMYKPAENRRWGYYALPILYGDRLVGKVDAKADRKGGVLEVYAVHQDVPFSKAMAAAVDAEIDDLARWLGVEPIRLG